MFIVTKPMHSSAVLTCQKEACFKNLAPLAHPKTETKTNHKRKFSRASHGLHGIAHFQNEWKPGTRVGARLFMGSFGGRMRICFQLCMPPNDLITERAPTVAPGFHSFWKWAYWNDVNGC